MADASKPTRAGREIACLMRWYLSHDIWSKGHDYSERLALHGTAYDIYEERITIALLRIGRTHTCDVRGMRQSYARCVELTCGARQGLFLYCNENYKLTNRPVTSMLLQCPKITYCITLIRSITNTICALLFCLNELINVIRCNQFINSSQH